MIDKLALDQDRTERNDDLLNLPEMIEEENSSSFAGSVDSSVANSVTKSAKMNEVETSDIDKKKSGTYNNVTKSVFYGQS